MKISKAILAKIPGLMALTIFLACKQTHGNRQNQAETSDSTDIAIVIDTFSTFPPEIAGCSCYFSSDTAQFNQYQYIYVSDLDKISFMKINGAMVMFTKSLFQKIDENTVKTLAENPELGISIEVIEEYQGGDEEISVKRGTITLTNKNGTSVVVSFFGECGC